MRKPDETGRPTFLSLPLRPLGGCHWTAATGRPRVSRHTPTGYTASMNSRLPRSISTHLPAALILIALSMSLAGCGNKGPLVLPEPAAPTDAATPVGPVETAPDAPAEPAATEASKPPAAHE